MILLLVLLLLLRLVVLLLTVFLVLILLLLVDAKDNSRADFFSEVRRRQRLRPGWGK